MCETSQFYIRGVPVCVRTLQSGDIAIWHPCNEQVRSIVEPICRPRGHWQSGYRNWIVFRYFSAVVIEQLHLEADHGGVEKAVVLPAAI